MDAITVATLGVFFAGIIYHAGRLSVRVEQLETFREESRSKWASIDSRLGELTGSLLRHP